MKPKNQVLRCISYILVIMLILPLSSSTMAQGIGGNDGELLEVTYSPDKPRIISVEIDNERLNPDDSITANISIKAETLIAYDITFSHNGDPESWLNNLTFLPLYPLNTYDLGSVTFKRGSSIIVAADKFGKSGEEAAYMVIIDLAVLVMHVIGEIPPTTWDQARAAISKAITLLPLGSKVMLLAKANLLMAHISEGESPTTILLDFESILETLTGVPEVIAELINSSFEDISIVAGDVAAALKAGKLLLNIPKVAGAIGDLLTAPAHAEAIISPFAMIVELPDFPVLQPGEKGTIHFDIQNIGAYTWQSGEYALKNVGGNSLGAMSPQALAIDVPPGYFARWELAITAPSAPGVYRTEWQMTHGETLFGPVMFCEVIVIPEGSGDLGELIEQLIEELKQRAEERFEQEWEKLRERIEELIQRELERLWREFWESLFRQCCGANVVAPVALLLGAWGISHKRRRRMKK